MVPFNQRLVSIKSKLTPGGFSGERIFQVDLANGDSYQSLAPRQFCWNNEGNLVAENEPTTEINGLIAAKIIDFVDDDQILVEVPDGEIIAVDKDNVQARPTIIDSPKPKSHVSV